MPIIPALERKRQKCESKVYPIWRFSVINVPVLLKKLPCLVETACGHWVIKPWEQAASLLPEGRPWFLSVHACCSPSQLLSDQNCVRKQDSHLNDCTPRMCVLCLTRVLFPVFKLIKISRPGRTYGRPHGTNMAGRSWCTTRVSCQRPSHLPLRVLLLEMQCDSKVNRTWDRPMFFSL